jgi:hypothetical protein
MICPLFLEVVHEGRAHVSGARPRHTIGSLVALEPVLVDPLRFLVVVGAVEEDNLVFPGAVGQDPKEILLRAAGFGEDDGFLRRTEFRRLTRRRPQCGEERLTFRIVSDGDGECSKCLKILDFLLNGLAISLREGFRRGFLLFPLVCELVQRLEVFLQRFFERLRPFGLSEAVAEPPTH